MAKEVAHPKNTGGGGLFFEDKVVAYFFACLLTDHLPLDERYGTIERLDFQVRVDGWHLDDVLITLRSPRGRHRMAASLKSNQQFSKAAAPADFVESAWETFLDRTQTKFNPALDLIGFVTLPPEAKLLHQFQELMAWARAQDTADLARRVQEAGYGKDPKRSLLKSLACPGTVATQFGQGAYVAADLLQCVQHLAYDFEHEPSNDLNRALGLCRTALTSGELVDARKLWEALCGLAREYRSVSGFINLTRLLDRLRGRFALKAYPQFEPDWHRLQQMSQDSIARVPDRIGGHVRLPRTEEIAKLRALPGSQVALIGQSGCGKTALSKQFVEARSADATILWLDARAFDVPNFTAFESQLLLQHSLTDLLAAFPGSSGYVVVDGLDRLFGPDVFANVATLFAKLHCDQDGPWHVLLTSQPEEWSRLQEEFLRVNFCPAWTIFDVEAPTDFGPLWEAFPDLEDLSRRKELRSLLLNPGILDLLALRIGSADPDKWAGESDLIEWLWHSVIAKQPHAAVRAGFVGALGEKQGDNSRVETPLTDFPPADLPPFDELVQDRICVSREGRAAFHHERYGDWARQRVLLSRIQDLGTYLEHRIANPTWHTAIRLLGLHLLEQNENIDRWKSVFSKAVTSGDDNPSLLQDLLLEAVIFATSPEPLLLKLWPELRADEGFWLKRLLTRFLHVATLPHPMMVRAMPEAAIEASAALRIPYWPYWLPILRYLCARRDDLLAFAPRQAAELVLCWLRQGGTDWHLRREVAEVGLALGRQMLQTVRDKGTGYSRDELPKLCFRAALVAASELPDEVSKFALDAAERTDDERPRPTQLVSRSSLHSNLILDYPAPWPDGPHDAVAQAFAQEVRDMGGLQPLITIRPAVAREVLLAALIDEPKPQSPWADRSMQRRHLDLEDVFSWHPPFYLRGPFCIFLKLSPEEGLEVVLRLINFAFDRWSMALQEENEQAPSVKMLLPDGEKTLIGDYNAYIAYTDNAAWPHSVISALMALEKWLYDELDVGRSINGYIQTILRRGNSVAFIGVLNAVACKEPSLWLGPLRPLLTVPEFHSWELQRSVLGRNRIAMMGWGREPGIARLAQEWQALPHRQLAMDKEAVRLFVTNEDIQPFMTEQSRKWDERRATETDPGMAHWLKQLAPRYRIENYEAHQVSNGIQIQYVPPEELRLENEKQLRKNDDRQGLIVFPTRCCQILEKGTALSSEEAEAVWQHVQRFADMPQAPEDDDGIMRTENCVCGGIAVLLTLSSAWLNADPTKKEWCLQWIYDLAANPPPPPRFDYEGDSSDWDWQTFCARIACLLWAEAPDDPKLRSLVASLVATRKYKTVEILFRTAASVRAELGDSFQDLQDFLFDWAGMRWRHEECQDGQNAGEWLGRQVEAFALRRRPRKSAPWAIASDNANANAVPVEGSRSKYPRMDLELVKAAYEWVPRLSDARNPEERSAWIAFWKYLQELSLQVASADTNGDEGKDSTPYQFDEWVIAHIAHLILQLEPGEREKFWKPFLDLGTKAHYWVERFVYHWLTIGLGGDKVPAEFASEWRQMIEFARSSPLWTADTDRRRHREKLWSEIMGLNVIVLWIADHQPLVAGMRDLFADWAGRYLKHSDSAGAFAYFLQNPAAEPILYDGIKWLEKANFSMKGLGRTGELVGIIARLLAKSWQHHSSKIQGNTETFAAFKRLLKRLCELQNPIALELSDRMRGS